MFVILVTYIQSVDRYISYIINYIIYVNWRSDVAVCFNKDHFFSNDLKSQ